jgi:xylulokinase
MIYFDKINHISLKFWSNVDTFDNTGYTIFTEGSKRNIMAVLMGIDLGTSSVKSMFLWSDTGRTQVFGEGYDISVPKVGWAEQDPLLWYEKTILTIRRLLTVSGVNPAEIRGIGFSGQMHGMVCLDEKKELLRPAIIWPDQRSAQSIRKIYDTLGASFVAARNQNTICTGFLLASLYWIYENEPESYRRIRHVMLPKDYIKFRLTGRIVTDYSDAAGSTAFDNLNMCWASELISSLGMDPSIFPACLPSAELIGGVTAAAAGETGLAKDIPVINGGADQCMQAIGNGIIGEGIFACNIGTGGQVSTSVSRPLYDSRLRVSTFAHAVPGKWNVMAATLSAGASLKWFAKQIAGITGYPELDRGVERVPPGSEGLIFLPYMMGERILLDPDTRGMFFGLTSKHDRYHLARAVMEGVAFGLRDCLDIIVNDIGIPCKKVVAAGGGAAGDTWLQIQADILDQPMVRSLNSEQACLGAAITAGIGTGVYAGAEAAAAELVRYEDRVFEPGPDNRQTYREYRAIFRELYLQNKELFKRITVLSKDK